MSGWTSFFLTPCTADQGNSWCCCGVNSATQETCSDCCNELAHNNFTKSLGAVVDILGAEPTYSTITQTVTTEIISGSTCPSAPALTTVVQDTTVKITAQGGTATINTQSGSGSDDTCITASSNTLPTRDVAIVGGVLGAGMLASVVALLLLLCCRRRPTMRDAQPAVSNPLMYGPEGTADAAVFSNMSAMQSNGTTPTPPMMVAQVPQGGWTQPHTDLIYQGMPPQNPGMVPQSIYNAQQSPVGVHPKSAQSYARWSLGSSSHTNRTISPLPVVEEALPLEAPAYQPSYVNQ